MTLEHSKKPSQVVLETGKPKQPQPSQAPEAKTPFAPMSAAQLQRARARFDRDTAALQRKVAPTEATPTNQAPEQQATPVLPAKQQALLSSFIKPPVQRKALENIKNQSIQASRLRAEYQAAITPEIVQRLADEHSTRQSQDARAAQAPNALNARTDWFNSELPVLRARHNNPDQAEFDSASVFNQSDTRARDLGKTYVAQRVASGLTANDAASAIVNIQRKRDRNNALKGMLSAIRPGDSDYARIQRLVGEKEQSLELQRRATEESVTPQATQLAKAEANPSQANSGISEKIKAKLGGGSPLPEHVRSQLEAGLNTDLSRVRVHTDGDADTLAKSVNAIAFTSGQDIFFSSGKFEPNTKTGFELIAHEVTHTIQQADGQVKPGIDSDPNLETAAQDSGAKLAANFEKNVKTATPKTNLASAPTSSAGSSQAAVQRLSDTSQLDQTLPTTIGKPEQIPGVKPNQNLNIPPAPIPSEARVVNEQKPQTKPSVPAKAPLKAKTAKPASKLKTPKSARVKAGNQKLPAALIKKPVTPKANKLEFQTDIKPTKTSTPTALKTNVNTRNIAFAPIPNLEKIDPSEKAKLLKQQADSTKAANATVQNLRKQAQSLEPHGAKLSAQITQAASAAKNLVTQAGSQQKALVNTQISALIAQAKSKGQASIGKNNSDAKAKTAALPGITNSAKQAISTSHQQQVQALKTKLEAQKALITAKYDANKGNYVTAGNTAGSEAKTVAAAKAETWRAGKTDESWWDKTKSYADFGAGPHPNDIADAKADADIQTGDGYAGGEGYPKVALEAFEKSKEGIERDFENFKTYFHDPRLQALDNQKNNAISQLQNSEKSAKQQIEQTRAQMESAMKAQLDGVLQQLTGQKTSLSATIDAAIKQSTSGIDAQSSSQIKGVQTALKTAATGIQSGISQLEAQMSGKNAPKPEVLKKMLGQIERSIASTVKQTLAQTSQSASASSKEFNSLAQTSITGMRSSTQQGIQTAKQSEQQLIQSLAQLVQSASTAYTKFQQTHKTTSAKTQADTIAEFTNILLSADPAFKAALEQLATNLENAATDYGKGLVAHANGPDFSRDMTKAEADAAAKVQPRWKGLLKILLIIVVIVVIALVIGPAVIGAVGAFAATMGAGAAAGAIGAVVGGAIVGALSGAVIQMGNNAIDGKAIMDGVGQAMVVGAISGAIGGGLGFAFSSGANAAATSSRAFLQTIGTKANSFAGKMVLDQLNGVVSGQFSSLLTTGKFQSFKELVQDPSTWIGFATSAATTRGGGPTRVNADTPNAPRITDINAPRVNVDAPNTPRVNGDVNAPRVNTDAPNAPRVDADAPKPSRVERFQNRVEGVQNRFANAGEQVGQTAGYKVGDVTGFNNVKVRTEVNPNLNPEQQRVSGFDEGKTKLELGEGAHPNDVKIHEDVAKQTRQDNSPLNKAKERILGTERETPVNSRKYELEFEAQKHERMAAWREQEAAKLPEGSPERVKLQREATDLRAKAKEYDRLAQDASTQKDSGEGEINRDRYPHLSDEQFKFHEQEIASAKANNSDRALWKARYERFRENFEENPQNRGKTAPTRAEWEPGARQIVESKLRGNVEEDAGLSSIGVDNNNSKTTRSGEPRNVVQEKVTIDKDLPAEKEVVVRPDGVTENFILDIKSIDPNAKVKTYYYDEQLQGEKVLADQSSRADGQGSKKLGVVLSSESPDVRPSGPLADKATVFKRNPKTGEWQFWDVETKSWTPTTVDDVARTVGKSVDHLNAEQQTFKPSESPETPGNDGVLAAAKFQEELSRTTQIIDQQVKSQPDSPQKTRAQELIKMIETLDFNSPTDQAVFYSGRYQDKSNHERAVAYAEQTGAMIVDNTPGGQYLASLGNLYDSIGPELADAVWMKASQMYAKGTTGKVTLFVQGASPERVFYKVEKPLLDSSPDVDQKHIEKLLEAK